MSRTHQNPLPPLLPAPTFAELRVQHDDTKFSPVKLPTAGTNLVYYLDSQVLLTWSNLDDSIRSASRINVASLQHGSRAEHGVIQVYYCPSTSHHPTLIPARDHGNSDFCPGQQANHCLELTSILCLPPRICQPHQVPSISPFDLAEWQPGADYSPTQTINPALIFPNLPTSSSDFLGLTGNPDANDEANTIPSLTSISFDQSPEQWQKTHETNVGMKDPSQQDLNVYIKQPRHLSNAKEQDLNTHTRKFKCKIIGCTMGFKRQDHLERHSRSHSKEKPFVCWVPGCHRSFSRRDNLKAHCTKTHARPGGRNRYVASLDKMSPDYDPEFRGPLSFDGRPL
ncbi:uncharacterized protein N7511_003500 [Penicillium nucicola]|uniref:uncharacterized protein n=1 Tax=Penicillium nucicola TaxID=1850975 RepID=UPI0025456686|nr:uncharacterized protein N7511_003500 [Penicillium nucicola]KAJ5771449.1 hypothetical protein N7511_003500 [Penicillium nucicola]